ncbi:ImmA/IrrE family metallo-endopeptidase [Planomonospora sp. ID67723]|uniref:ImmA/IrrE family metallo-endopeptidase n=1 Tax=Planomonospora sp. ID67723 TaxID=2738134 RepID=UPI0018C39C6F|nr:ImmA/IrrE family metallo-endopeptidase [Planomonospora sp. ID67723]MBG0826800.1 ImmA/IrrE family metallo-endopeptidase [Planomonospora sp. ID67723]
MEEIAREVRKSIGLSINEPIDYLTHPIERAGVVVAVRRRKISEASMDADDSPGPRERHEGCSTWVGEFRERPLIMMRAVDTWEKTRWVLSHELGHIVLHAGRMPVNETAEEEASQFANEFLAPIESVTNDLPRTITLAALAKAKMKWGISISALIRHLHHNKVISDQRKQTLYAQLYTRRNPETGRSYGVTEPGWDARVPERPRLIAAWLSHTVGSTIPEIVSHTSEIWPSDLLSEVIAEQRSAPARARFTGKPKVTPPSGAQIIPMPTRGSFGSRQAQ